MINELVIQSYTTAQKKGFWNKHRSVGEMLMLVVSELGEAIEAHRNDDDEGFREEIADTFIRLADMCGGLGIPIWEYIEKKMAINKDREFLHGKLY